MARRVSLIIFVCCSFLFFSSVNAISKGISEFKNCVVVKIGSNFFIPGIGVLSPNGVRFNLSPNVTILDSSLRNADCVVDGTTPVTNQEIISALKENTNEIDKSIKDMSKKMQLNIASSFAVQLDIISGELSEIRSTLNGQPEDDVKSALVRLDKLEKLIERMEKDVNSGSPE